MKKRKKKENKDSTLSWKVSQRIKNDEHDVIVSGPLTSLNISIEIKAKPKDWITMRENYPAFKEDLFRDFYPFMQRAVIKAQRKKPRNEARAYFKQIMNVQAGLLYSFLSFILKNQNKEYLEAIPSLNTVIKSIKRGDLRRNRKGNIDPKELTYYFIEKVYKEWFEHNNKLNPLTDNRLTFHKYIYEGKKIIQSDQALLRKSISFVHMYLYETPCKKEIRPIFNFLLNLTRAIHIQYRSSIDPSIVARNIENPEELDLIRKISKEIFPSISFPL